MALTPSSSSSKVAATKDVVIEKKCNNTFRQFFVWLQTLPNEVVLKIFNDLPANLLIAIKESGHERFSSLLYYISKADFSECRLILPGEVKLMNTWTSHITEINFNYLIHASASVLESLILHCKLLRVISVLYCGFTFKHIYTIFSKLKNVVDLSWNVADFPETCDFLTFFDVSVATDTLNKLQRLYVTIESFPKFSNFIKYLLRYCGKIQELHVDFISNVLFRTCTCNDLHEPTNKLNIDPSFPNLNSVILSNCTLEPADKNSVVCIEFNFLEIFLNALSCSKKPNSPWKKLWIQLINVHDDILQVLESDGKIKELCVPCLYLNEDSEYCTYILENATPQSIEILGLDTEVFQLKDVENILRAGGKRLKKFSVALCTCILKPDASLETLFCGCSNITELNLSGVHFFGSDVTSPCQAIRLLKDLHRLCLSTCAIKYNSSEKMHSTHFENMVTACPLVKEFHFQQCSECLSRKFGKEDPPECKDEDLKALHLWSNLETLKLSLLVSLRTCSFLRGISFHCKKFASLHIDNIGHPDVCHYTQSLIFLMRNSKSLCFVSIAQSAFNYHTEGFWKTVGCADNLQGLCIATHFSGYINVAEIVNNIKKLKNFYVFHFYCPVVVDSTLEKKVRSALNATIGRNGPDIIIDRAKKYKKQIVQPFCHFHHCGFAFKPVGWP